MRFPDWLPVYGEKSYRGECASETTEQIDFMSWLACYYPDYHRTAVHPKNEGKRTHAQADIDRKIGALNAGASDVIIPAGFVMEIKRRDHIKSSWQRGQKEYLLAAKKTGCFVCVALGCDGAKLAFLDWIRSKQNERQKSE